MDKTHKVPAGFALSKLNVEQFAIIEDAFSDGEAVGLETTLQFAFNSEAKQIKCTVGIRFEQAGKPFLIFVSSNEYRITPETWESYCSQDGGDAGVFPKEFMAHLAALAVGTARGMLHVKTENSLFNRFFLPTINVAEMITEDLHCKPLQLES